MTKMTAEFLQLIETALKEVPSNSGQQFINVSVNVGNKCRSGTVSFGLKHKLEMGEYEFRSLDECLSIIREIKDSPSYNKKKD